MGPHENINPNPMPEGLSPYNKYLVPKPITSTTYVYEPYKETTYAPPPLPEGLPEYTSRKYDAEHDPAIPYREPENPYEKPQQPYQHYFPKYTTTYYYPEYTPSTANQSTVHQQQNIVLQQQSTVLHHQSTVLQHQSTVLQHQSTVLQRRSTVLQRRSTARLRMRRRLTTKGGVQWKKEKMMTLVMLGLAVVLRLVIMVGESEIF